jgi:Uma2 family endonuclease
MTMTTPERVMTPLRKAAEAAEEASGLRAEIIHGILMMSPTPRGKHAGIITDLFAQLLPVLPADLAPYQVASLPLPHDPDDYATPDLMVCDAEFGESDEWLAAPGSVALVVEVVSQSNSTKDTRDMPEWYAEAGIPVYVLIDPRDGTWVRYTAPRDGAYQGRLRGRYGEDIELADLGVKLSTGGFVRYA